MSIFRPLLLEVAVWRSRGSVIVSRSFMLLRVRPCGSVKISRSLMLHLETYIMINAKANVSKKWGNNRRMVCRRRVETERTDDIVERCGVIDDRLNNDNHRLIYLDPKKLIRKYFRRTIIYFDSLFRMR
mmetsp:Transcript_22398/g.44881  ORF Transcript_22398/g.44881 Transcript_22398/m.44881 type:complete len:129 (+) Transcript_22398:1001-1387(+)